MNTIQQIINDLTACDKAYYNSETPKLTDDRYDSLKDEVRSFVSNHDNKSHTDYAAAVYYLTNVGSAISTDLPSVVHAIHMGSQNHSRNPVESKVWYDKYCVNHPIILTWKMDGSSVAITYKNGKLLSVITRGDGVSGNDITKNARKWMNLPHTITLKGTATFRGEAQLFKKEWESLKNTKSARSVGNGIIMRKDDTEDHNKLIKVTIFDGKHDDLDSIPLQSDFFKAIELLGFDVVKQSGQFMTFQDALTYFSNSEKVRPTLGFQVDGMVAYLNDRNLQEELGYSDGGKRPVGQLAWKFSTEKKSSHLRDISHKVGKTGRLAPVAIIDPIEIDGKVISNVTLDNYRNIIDLNLNIGDEILIENANDVIPHFNSVLKKKSSGHWNAPTHCPSCATKMEWSVNSDGESGAHWICPNEMTCPAQEYGRVNSYISKMNILGLGEAVLTGLFDAQAFPEGMVSLYHLTYSGTNESFKAGSITIDTLLIGNGVFGTKRAMEIVKNIQATKGCDFALWFGSLGIPHVSRSQSKKLTEYLVEAHGPSLTIDTFLTLTAQELMSFNIGIGEVKSREIVSVFTKEADFIRTFYNLVKPVFPTVTTSASIYTFCLTGKMSREKKEIKADIIKAGYAVSDDMNSAVTHLVQADAQEVSDKAKKAMKRGIPIISETDLMAMLKQ